VNYLTDAVNCLDHTVANGTIITGKRPWNTLRYYRSICMERLRNTTKFHNQDNYYMGRDLNTLPANTHKSLLLKPICHFPQFVTYNKPRQNQFQLLASYLHSIRENEKFSPLSSITVLVFHISSERTVTPTPPPPSLQPTYRRKHACICKELAFMNANDKAAWSRPPYPKTYHKNKIRSITPNIQC